MTDQNSAHLASAVDDQYYRLEKLHGEQGARLAAESHTAAIRRIEEIVRSENIACNFERVDAWLFVPPGDSTDDLGKELEAARRAGLQAEPLARAPIAAYDTGPCLRFSGQAQFHPLRYLAGLANAITSMGGQIFTSTHAEKMEGGQPVRVTTSNGHVVTAAAIVVATNTPVNDRLVMHTKQVPYMSYVIAANIPARAAVKALYYDTREDVNPPDDIAPDSYHYVRIFSEKNSGGNGGENKSEPDRCGRTGSQNRAERRRRTTLRPPRSLGQGTLAAAWRTVYRWAGQVMEPADALAFIGPNPMDASNVFIATGDSGNGLTHGTIAGILLTDLIAGRDSP